MLNQPDPKAESTKAALRQHYKNLLRAQPATALSAAAITRFMQNFPLTAASCFAFYWPLPDELDPRPLALAAQGMGAALALPYVQAPNTPLQFRLYQPDTALIKDHAGLLAPPASSPTGQGPTVTPTHILVPLLAFDLRGNRLGRGGGYYDRTLPKHPQALHIGCGYQAQLAAHIPTTTHDAPLRYVLTETTLHDCRAQP